MKKLAANLLLLFILLCTAENTFARGNREKDRPKTQKVEISGRVRMVGSSPMTSLVISGENREWYIEPEEQEKLIDFQQQTVTVRADEYYYDRVFANGASAGRQYYIKNIVIIGKGINTPP
jgi:hypothetical protein